MRRLATRIWRLPWPAPIRQAAMVLLKIRPIEAALLPHFLVGVVGLITNESGDVLLLRHTYRREYPWGLPSGFLEHGEQPREALRRELAEETGLTVSLAPTPSVYSEYNRRLVNIVFAGAVHGRPAIRPSAEISDGRFFGRDQLPGMMPDQRRLVESHWHGGGSPSQG